MAFSSELSASEHQQMQQWIGAHGTPQQVALRCRIILAAAQGPPDVTIAEQLAVNRKTVILWRRRFSEQRLDGLWKIAPGRGRKATYESDKIAAIVAATLQTRPEGMTHWSCRTMAKSQGVSKSTINNMWLAHNLKPHRVETFKLSRDPKLLDKMDRCGRPVLESTRSGHRAVRGRKEPDSGTGSDSARVADQEGPLWDHDPRLQASWHHDFIRRPGNIAGKGHRPLLSAASESGVPPLLAYPRPGVPRQGPAPSHPG